MVYCNNCRYHGIDEYSTEGWCNAPANKKLIHTPLGKYWSEISTPYKLNQHNNCPYYIRKWWKWWVKNEPAVRF